MISAVLENKTTKRTKKEKKRKIRKNVERTYTKKKSKEEGKN